MQLRESSTFQKLFMTAVKLGAGATEKWQSGNCCRSFARMTLPIGCPNTNSSFVATFLLWGTSIAHQTPVGQLVDDKNGTAREIFRIFEGENPITSEIKHHGI